MSLTARQRHALAELADGGEHTPGRLAAALRTSVHGAAATASSLIRHGYAQRLRDRGRVVYRITDRGLGLVRHDQLRITALSIAGGVALALVVVGIPLVLGRLP